MIGGGIESGEVLEVRLDLGAIGDGKADRAEQGFDPFEGSRHRMQATGRLAAAGQRDIERLLGQPGVERQLPNRFAPSVERRFDGVLGAIDRCPGSLSLVGRKFSEAFQQFGNAAALAEIGGLDLLKRVRVISGGKGARRCFNNWIEVVHVSPKKRRLAPPFLRPSRLSVELGLGLHGQSGKSRLVEDRQIGQHLAVDLDLRLSQAIHESAVFHAGFPGCRVDTGNPEAAELTLALPTVTIGVLSSLHDRLFGDAIDVFAAAAVTLGQGDDLLVARVRGYTTFDSGHRRSPYA
jgi:hypothetical protein